MAFAFFLALMILVIGLVFFAVYLLLRVSRIYLRARRLDRMRAYETVIYAGMVNLSPEDLLGTLLPDPDPAALEEALLHMADNTMGESKEKIAELYRLGGFAAKRLRRLGSPLRKRRVDSARRLGRIGDPGAVSKLVEARQDRREEVREEAGSALRMIGTPEATADLKKLNWPDPDPSGGLNA